jgi:hypothetical protein
VATTGLARQTKDVDPGNIEALNSEEEALNSEELGSQMDVNAGQNLRNWAILLDVLRMSLKGRSGPR